MFNFICIIGFLISLFLMGLGIEIMRFPRRTPRENANQLKRDLVDLIKGFWEKPRIRHIFEPGLAEDIKTIVKPYSIAGMDIDVVSNIINGIPFIGIEFVPNHPYEVEILGTLCEHLKIKFRRYLLARNLQWLSFSTYTQAPNDIQIYIYYAEFEEDIPLLKNKYKEVLLEKVNADFGYLHDDDLEKELKDVNTPGV